MEPRVEARCLGLSYALLHSAHTFPCPSASAPRCLSMAFLVSYCLLVFIFLLLLVLVFVCCAPRRCRAQRRDGQTPTTPIFYSSPRRGCKEGHDLSRCFGLRLVRASIGPTARPTVSCTHARPGSCSLCRALCTRVRQLKLVCAPEGGAHSSVASPKKTVDNRPACLAWQLKCSTHKSHGEMSFLNPHAAYAWMGPVRRKPSTRTPCLVGVMNLKPCNPTETRLRE